MYVFKSNRRYHIHIIGEQLDGYGNFKKTFTITNGLFCKVNNYLFFAQNLINNVFLCIIQLFLVIHISLSHRILLIPQVKCNN